MAPWKIAVLLLLWAPTAAADEPAAEPAAPARVSQETPAPPPPDCEGRNPFYCGIAVQAQEEEGEESELLPPGACEGRNPLYCKEAAPVAVETPAPKERERRASESSRNQNRNPRQNPNRNRRRRSSQ